jgi:hypothetical protein
LVAGVPAAVPFASPRRLGWLCRRAALVTGLLDETTLA